MATHCGLGKGIKVLRREITRSTVAGWRKEVLVDVLMSLAVSSGMVPGLDQHLEAAYKLSIASPANGGGMDVAMRYLKNVGQQPTSQSPSTESSHDDPDCGDGSVSGNGSSDGAIGSQPVVASQPQVTGESTSTMGPGLCRSNWKGTRCCDDTCTRVHRDYCLRPSCYPSRDTTCPQWHPRSWTAPNVQGNWHKGSGQPVNKVARTKSKSKQVDTILSRENKLLKQEIALYKERSRLFAKKHSQTTRSTTYRDAVVSGRPGSHVQRSSQLIITPSTQTPQMLKEPLPDVNSATALPVGILAAIQLAVEKALINRNPH